MVKARWRGGRPTGGVDLGNMEGGLSLKVTEEIRAGEKEEWSGWTNSAVRV
ncbi:MAG: hypothetical protein G01um101416_236 [Microgenomates group bacterium Gr01-1014_16]|nr:MAG: hypothetical protein G01um101416_236 [Microgenomates group bacterium Gr01-1014_16]